jgi:hypothetical protein
MLFASSFQPTAQEFKPMDATNFGQLKYIKEFKPFIPFSDGSASSFTPYQAPELSPFIPSHYAQGYA